MRKDNFGSFHPVINFLYFVIVLGVSMFMMNPIFLAISLAGGLSYYIYLKGKTVIKTTFYFMVPVFLVSAIVNPLFNHQGVTLLFYFSTGNPVTLESIIYGMATGLMLVTVINWFSCYQVVMTSDKFIYLFGKAIPAMSLVFSMVLRFVPKFKNQIKKVSDAQKCIGRDVTNGNGLQRAGHGMKILSIMTTWALENSVETADSMKSRGYGLRGRTNFSIYRFDSRDRILLGVLAGTGAVVFWGIVAKKVSFLYYPMITMAPVTPGAAICYVCYGIICFLPFFMDIWEEIKWHYLKSGI